MAKKSSERPGGIEIQRGPIRMDQQYNIGFCRQPEKTLEDIANNEMREWGKTMDLHTPKR